MSLSRKTKAELLEIIEADGEVVRRARQALNELQEERFKRMIAEKQLAEVPVKVVKEYQPCPEQNAELARLKKQLAEISPEDIKLAKEYQRRVNLAKR